MDTPDESGWVRYLAGFHDQRPGITERLLVRADRSPYGWLAQPLQAIDGPILDLACGSAPTRDVLPESRWLGIDSSPGELAMAAEAGRGPVVRASAGALPLRDSSVNAVCAAMCLQVLTPLDGVLAELRRVMRPGATLAALVPSRLGASPGGWLGWLRVMRAIGVRNLPWPNPQARDGIARVLRTCHFEVVANDRQVFTLDTSSPESMRLLVEALYLPGLDPQRIAHAQRTLAGRARPGHRLPFPLRRVVASTPLRD